MKSSKNEDRIIARILRGELSIDNKDIEHLANADLTEEQEQIFNNLADEIKETVKENRAKRKEVQAKIEQVETDPLDKIDLLRIEDDIRDANIKLKNAKDKPLSLLCGGLGATVVFGLAFPLIASAFTSSLFWLVSTFLVGFNLGVIPATLLIGKSYKDQEKLKQQIKKLEQERFELLESKNSNMPERDVEKTKNITKHIYASKNLDEEYKEVSFNF